MNILIILEQSKVKKKKPTTIETKVIRCKLFLINIAIFCYRKFRLKF